MPGRHTLVRLIARVESRSEGAAEERPVVVWLGTERCLVNRILDDSVVGPADAGTRSERRIAVELDNGDVLVLHRSLPAGDWRVYRQVTTAEADAMPGDGGNGDSDDRR